MHTSDQFPNSFESIPVVTPEVHLLLEETSTGLLSKLDVVAKIESLREIFILIQDVDRDLVSRLQTLQMEGDVSVEDMLIAALYFLVTKQIGPDSSKLRDMIYNLHTDVETFSVECRTLEIPPHTQGIIIAAYKKLWELTKRSDGAVI
jgi:hypothetical protein